MRAVIYLVSVLLVSCSGSGGNSDPASGNQPSGTDFLKIPLPIDIQDANDFKAIQIDLDSAPYLVLLDDRVRDDNVIEIYYSDNKGKNWIEDNVVLIDYDSRIGETSLAIGDSASSGQFYFTTGPVVATNSTLLYPNIRLRNYALSAHAATLVSEGSNSRYKLVQSGNTGNLLYHSTHNGGGPASLEASRDEGVSYTNIGSFFPPYFADENLIGCPMTLESATSDGRVAVKCGERFVSYNEGMDWRQLPSLPDFGEGIASLHWQLTLILDPLQPKVIYLFDNPKQVLYRNDGSSTWDIRPLPEEVLSLYFSETDENVIYAAAGSAGAYISLNGGLTWELLEGDLNGLNVFEVQIVQGELYLFTDQGVYYRQTQVQ